MTVILQPMKNLDGGKCNRGSQQGAVLCIEVHKMVQEPFQEKSNSHYNSKSEPDLSLCLYSNRLLSPRGNISPTVFAAINTIFKIFPTQE